MTNQLARQRLELFASTYTRSVQPANALIKDGKPQVPERDHFLRAHERTIERLAKDGLI